MPISTWQAATAQDMYKISRSARTFVTAKSKLHRIIFENLQSLLPTYFTSSKQSVIMTHGCHCHAQSGNLDCSYTTTQQTFIALAALEALSRREEPDDEPDDESDDAKAFGRFVVFIIIVVIVILSIIRLTTGHPQWVPGLWTT